VAREHRGPSIIAAILLLLLLAAAVAGTGLAIRASREKARARKAEQQAAQREKKAQDVAAEYKSRFQQSEATWKATTQELRYAQTSAEEARRSEREMQNVLDFFKRTLLSAGRPGGGSLPAAFWAEGRGQDVTLRKALDSTDSRVNEAFADRPLAEAPVREMLGLGYLNVGEPARAVQQYERALALREATQGDNHPDAAACRNQLAIAYRLAGRPDEGSRLFDMNPNSPDHASALAVRGALLLLQKQPAEAELRLRECLTIRRKIQPDNWTTFETESMLGEALLEQKKYAEAEPLLLSGHDGMKQREDTIPPHDKPRVTRARERLVKLYEAWGKEDKAKEWRGMLTESAATQKS
jgi:tetratricopeptide (TPR) repeat protein